MWYLSVMAGYGYLDLKIFREAQKEPSLATVVELNGMFVADCDLKGSTPIGQVFLRAPVREQFTNRLEKVPKGAPARQALLEMAEGWLANNRSQLEILDLATRGMVIDSVKSAITGSPSESDVLLRRIAADIDRTNHQNVSDEI